MPVQKGSRAHRLLEALFVGGGITVISMVSPVSGAIMVRGAVKSYFRKKRFEKEKFLRDIKRLQTRLLIDYRELADGKIKVILTKQGRHKVLIDSLDTMALKKSSRWDGKWRLVIFDIPHVKKKAREAFRSKLRLLGFYPLQKSVFLTPHPCEDEIDFLCSIFDVRDHVLLLYISRFEGEEKLRHHFGI